jgi:hypothetical protein
MALQIADFAAYENYKCVEREPQYKRREPSTALTPFWRSMNFATQFRFRSRMEFLRHHRRSLTAGQ